MTKSPDMWAGSDPLGDTLHSLRMEGVFYVRSELTGPWGLDIPVMNDCVWFHMVVSGSARLEVDNLVGESDGPQALRAGDCILVTHGLGHRLLSDARAPTVSMYEPATEWISDRYIVIRHGGGGQETVLICGAVQFVSQAARGLMDLLPSVVHVPGTVSPHRIRLDATLNLLAIEAADRRPGGEAVITRIADILVIQMIRAWMDEDPQAQTGWLGALRDKHIGRALAAIHREPERAWTVESLAQHVLMSRSAFAARFTDLVGEPVVGYLTRWRMQLAANELREGGKTATQLAGQLGYQSEAAFSRAFKRTMGASPRQYARRA